jgi:GT2 family glycosyltransferase
MHEKVKVAVVILNWNGIHYLKTFLPGVIRFSEGAAIVVADNASTDDSVKWLYENHPAVRIVLMDSNYGFAGGYNKALKQIDAKFYVLLNSDVEVTEGWLNDILSKMTADVSIAACQPKIKSYAQRNLLEHAGGAGGFMDYLGYPFCRGRIYLTLEEDKGQYDTKSEIFWASGACLFIRSDVFHHSNGFDEEFFAHMEEIDLCWRIHHQGYKVMVFPETTVFHVGGGTLPKSHPRKTYYNFRNNLLMLHKNLPGNKLTGIFIVRLILDGLAGIKFLISGYPKDCFSVIKAHIYFYSNLKKRKKIRAEAQKLIINHTVPGIYRRSIVWDYYIAGCRYFSQLHNDFTGKK